MKHKQAATRPLQEDAATPKPTRSTRTGNGQGQLAAGNGHEELIRQKAYSLYEARQGEPGHELDDWLRAEAQLSQEASRVETGQGAPGQELANWLRSEAQVSQEASGQTA